MYKLAEAAYCAEDVEGEVIATLVVNSFRYRYLCCCQSTWIGDRRKAMLEDIAILTGGTVISEEVGLDLKDATIDQLGTARTVTVDKENTTIVEGGGDQEQIKNRIASIKAQIEKRLQSTIVKSCRSALLSCLAV